ncbi:MAG: hypothetical protein H8E21_02115 [Gammaproteobacteria bacterium]|nr:hypothetical protein [Gammaproteobacteria bacterium]MBL6999540.1 hypothetical protein [Gammaproteobacteria bacterium]
MEKKRSFIIALSGFFFSAVVGAESGWTDYVNVAELVPTARHYYEFRLPVKENPAGCREKAWFYQDYSSSGSEMMFKTLLEGVTSRIRLRVYVTGKCNMNGYSEISSVSIVP